MGRSARDSNKVAIIVLNWNGWPDTIECLASLLPLQHADYQIIVVDNGSTDDSVSKIKAWTREKTSITLIETGKNLGYAGGNNVGLRFALARSFDYFWILNNDTVVEPDALHYLVERMRARPDVGLCGPTILYYHDRKRIWALGGAYNKWFAEGRHLENNKSFDRSRIDKYYQLERKVDYLVGASLLVSRAFLQNVGLMCEDYFLFFEELDWAIRARGRYRLALAPQAVVYHKVGASFAKSEGGKQRRFNLTADYYGTRNRLAFTQKYFPYALPALYLSILGYIIDRIRLGAWENAALIAKLAVGK